MKDDIAPAVTLAFAPTNDHEITCIVCGADHCELESVAYATTKGGSRSRVWIGKHARCELRPAAPWPDLDGEPDQKDDAPDPERAERSPRAVRRAAVAALAELLAVVDEKDERGEPTVGRDMTDTVNWLLDFADKVRPTVVLLLALKDEADEA